MLLDRVLTSTSKSFSGKANVGSPAVSFASAAIAAAAAAPCPPRRGEDVMLLLPVQRDLVLCPSSYGFFVSVRPLSAINQASYANCTKLSSTSQGSGCAKNPGSLR